MLTLELTQQIIRVLKPHDPKMIGVFGSYARGENTSSSDLDVLVQFGSSIGLIQLVQLQQELSDILDIPVDLVTKNSLRNPRLKEYIFKDLITIFYEEGQPHLNPL
jgi:predicted nucleotidyltransferase